MTRGRGDTGTRGKNDAETRVNSDAETRGRGGAANRLSPSHLCVPASSSSFPFASSKASPRLKRVSQNSCILFDLDGTLVDTTDLILTCFRCTWDEAFGYCPPDTDFIDTFGILLTEALELLVAAGIAQGKIELTQERGLLINRLLELYRKFNMSLHDQLIRPFEEVPETLSKLAERGYRLGVVTSKRRLTAIRSLDAFSLREFFDVAIFADDCQRHKPHPEPVLRALDYLQCAPAQAAYVGDTSHDVAAGRAAGVRTVAALWGPFPRTSLEAAKPDYLIPSISSLLEIFR